MLRHHHHLQHRAHSKRQQLKMGATHSSNVSSNASISSKSTSHSRSGASHRAAAARKSFPAAYDLGGEGLLKAPKLVLTESERQRLDESPDANFYSTPRMMQHVDDNFIAALRSIYSCLLPPGACVLELCASRHSHLPPDTQPRLMVGQGMNSAELAANPDLHQHFVQDLNLQPLLLEQLDASYDVVLCVNGIQYLTQPETVVTEASRVLRPGGMLVVAFGQDCFRDKALAGWLSRSMQERTQLVQQVLQSNGFDPPFTFDSPQAAAAALSAGGAAAGQQPQAQPESLVTAGGGVGAQQQQRSSASKLQVLLAFNSVDVTAGATEPDVPGGADMRPENVQSWFTKPGLAGLAEAAAADAQQPTGSSQATPSTPTATNTAASQGASQSAANTNSSTSQPQHKPTSAPPPLPPAGGSASSITVDERLLGQWHAAYGQLVVDAVDLGIPRSVIPDVAPTASPAELQEAVQHLQAMMASFLSAGL